MIVLDTNVVSEALRREPDTQVLAWLESLTDEVAITAVTLAELLAGVRRLPPGRRRTTLEAAIDTAVEPYLETRAVLPFDAAAANAYADVLVMRERVGRPIHTADAQIAAICRARAATCATRNLVDFEGTGVQLVDPWTV